MIATPSMGSLLSWRRLVPVASGLAQGSQQNGIDDGRTDPRSSDAPHEARGSGRSPTPTPSRRWGRSPSSGYIPTLERHPEGAGSRQSAGSYRDSWITPFDGLRLRGSRGLERLGKRNKKSRRGGTPRGIRPRRLTRQRAPRPSRVAFYLVIRQLRFRFSYGAECESTPAPSTTFIVPRGTGKASEFFSDLLCHRSVRSSSGGAGAQ